MLFKMLRKRYGRARSPSWAIALFRTSADDKAANKAFMKAREEKDKLESMWSKAMTKAAAGDASAKEWAVKLAAQAAEQDRIIAAAQKYARLPQEGVK
jgi:hypothetical protein